MSDNTIIQDDHIKQIKDNERNKHNVRTDSIKIDIVDTEINKTEKNKAGINDEEHAESANKQGKDEAVCLEALKHNEHVAKTCKDLVGTEYMVYGYYSGGQNQASLPVTWVQFQGGFDRNRVDPTGEPLAYEPSSRNSFVKLVFCIVFVMLLCTAGFTLFVLATPDVKNMFRRYGFMLALPAMIIMIGMSYAMACSACTRIFPCNIVCLIIAVLCMSVITGFITSRYDTSIVFYALIATAVTVFVCICLACTNFDFTKWMLYVVAISVVFGVITCIIMVTMLLMNEYWKPVHLVILLIGSLLNVIILIIELQTILGGKAVEMGEDDYALGAYLLYTSIIDIFLKLVQILGILDNF